MRADRLSFRLVLLVGLVATAVFHAGGPVDERDALAAATVGSTGALAQGLGVDLVRLVDARVDLFRAIHLVAGILLAVAAALSAAVASRLTAAPGAGLAAGLFVGCAVVFGGDIGRFGMDAGPVPVLMVLLAGSLSAWSSPRPRPFLGGLLLGTAVAVHPFALLLLPGWLGFARATGRPAAFAGRAALGFVLGTALLHVPHAGGAFGSGIEAWWGAGEDGAFWSLAGPGSWGGGAAELGGALWRNAGPIGILSGLLGAFVALRHGPGMARSFVWMLAPPAAALILGSPADAPTAVVVTAWTFLFLAAPAADALGRRLGATSSDLRKSAGAAFRLPGLGLLAGAYLLAANVGTLDRSAEISEAWARDSLEPLPPNSLFLTQNPAHRALAADLQRRDVETLFVRSLSPAAIRKRLPAHGTRPVLMDASLFFDTRKRAGVLGDDLRVYPHGLTFHVLPSTREFPQQSLFSVWDDMALDVDAPPLAMRDGLGTQRFYARSILQSAFIFLDSARPADAEAGFLCALSYGATNKTLAAMGLGRLFLQRRDFGAAILTLEKYARTEDEGAWNALQLLGTAYAQVNRPEDAVRTFRRALPLVPRQLSGEREKIERMIERLRDAAAGAPR